MHLLSKNGTYFQTSEMFKICPSSSSYLKHNRYPEAQLSMIAMIGCLVSISGSVLRVWSQRSLGKFFTWEVSIQPGHRLYTAGPYLAVRHPSYTALVMACVGQAMLFLGQESYAKCCVGWSLPRVTLIGFIFVEIWQLILVVTVVNRTVSEDGVLRKEFGMEWEEWAKRTYRLFPGVY
jgi:protein-S-isoprenylcysteine O-methyltransferase Ste14